MLGTRQKISPTRSEAAVARLHVEQKRPSQKTNTHTRSRQQWLVGGMELEGTLKPVTCIVEGQLTLLAIKACTCHRPPLYPSAHTYHPAHCLQSAPNISFSYLSCFLDSPYTATVLSSEHVLKSPAILCRPFATVHPQLSPLLDARRPFSTRYFALNVKL